MPEEHRQFIRIPSRLTTVFKNLKTGKVRRALTKDVSGSGMCLITEELLEPGTQLEIEFTLPDRPAPITCRAQVMWSRPVGTPKKSYQSPTGETGVKVMQIDPKDQVALAQYVTFHAPPSAGW